eukprot:1395248-Alexandrium_andersonii.AAC.1
MRTPSRPSLERQLRRLASVSAGPNVPNAVLAYLKQCQGDARKRRQLQENNASASAYECLQ